MHPELSGASAVIAAGSRDSNVYLWRRRPSPVGGAREGGQRRMREFTHTELVGHKVRGRSRTASTSTDRHSIPCAGVGVVSGLRPHPSTPLLGFLGRNSQSLGRVCSEGGGPHPVCLLTPRCSCLTSSPGFQQKMEGGFNFSLEA